MNADELLSLTGGIVGVQGGFASEWTFDERRVESLADGASFFIGCVFYCVGMVLFGSLGYWFGGI